MVLAQTPDGLPPVPSSFYQEAQRKLKTGDHAGAEHYLNKVVLLEPTYTPAWCRLGTLRARRRDRDGAHRAWKRGPFDPHCLEAFGRDLIEEDPEGAARLLGVLERAVSDPAVGLLLAQVSEPERALGFVETFLELREGSHPDLLAALEPLVDLEQAQDVLLRAMERDPEIAEALEGQLESLEVERQADALMGAAPMPLTEEQETELAQIRRDFARGDRSALTAAETLSKGAARNPAVWASLADLREAVGDVEGAERALWLARRLDPLNADLQLRHAEMLETQFGGRFADEAFEALHLAVQVQPTGAVLWRHAELALRTGRYRDARSSLTQLAKRGPRASDAQALLVGLGRERADPPMLPSLGTPVGVDAEAWRATHLAQVWWQRARRSPVDLEKLGRAREQVDLALELEPSLRKARNLRAQIRWMQGDRDGALADWRQSLSEEAQPAVLVRLAEIERQGGNQSEADRLLVAASEAGSSVAVFRLAERDANTGRWWSALQQLDVYFSRASSGRVHEAALALQADLRRRLAFAGLGTVSMFAMGVFGVLALWRYRRGGVGVVQWLERAPRSVGDVARVVSAIRHEVLKHNISALPMIADAVEVGEADVPWASNRLGGALTQLDRYLEELVERARVDGVRLNLRRDPDFAPLIAGAEKLARAKSRLGNRKTATELRDISELLNQQVYRGLGELVRGVCVLELTADPIDRAWRAVCTEVAGAEVDFTIECPPLCVRMFPSDLHDVLVNLLRNGLAASRNEERSAMGVRVAVDEDLITGLARAEIRVCDQVEKRLTTAMIRGRYIDRGLGLAVDLVSRAGGSVHVEKEPGWAKAVVVRLPLEEG